MLDFEDKMFSNPPIQMWSTPAKLYETIFR